MVSAAAPKPRLTHFLSLPLRSAELEASLHAFRQEVTSPLTTPIRDVQLPDAAILPYSTMHITLGVLSLTDDGQVQAVRDILRRQNLKDHFAKACEEAGLTQTARRESSFVGLRSFGSAIKARVAYIPPSGAKFLPHFAESIRAAFGVYIEDRERTPVLHATVINVGKGKVKGKKLSSFNAKELFARYEGHSFANNVPLDEVQLCEMGAQVGDDGEQRYTVVESVGFSAPDDTKEATSEAVKMDE